MPPVALVDTGAMIALIDAADHWHPACKQALGSLHMPLLTTEAVLTELFHLIRGKTRNAWEFVRSGAISVRTMSDSDLPALNSLMEKYKDRPMDFADATLVHLAERESLSLILTIDNDDFETYRIAGRKKFTILPGPKARS